MMLSWRWLLLVVFLLYSSASSHQDRFTEGKAHVLVWHTNASAFCSRKPAETQPLSASTLLLFASSFGKQKAYMLTALESFLLQSHAFLFWLSFHVSVDFCTRQWTFPKNKSSARLSDLYARREVTRRFIETSELLAISLLALVCSLTRFTSGNRLAANIFMGERTELTEVEALFEVRKLFCLIQFWIWFSRGGICIPLEEINEAKQPEKLKFEPSSSEARTHLWALILPKQQMRSFRVLWTVRGNFRRGQSVPCQRSI